MVTGPELGLPLIEEKCLAWMECRLLPATAAQTQYDTLFGEVVSAAADERAFVTGRWQFDDDKLNTLHHLGTGNFVASGRHVRANSSTNKPFSTISAAKALPPVEYGTSASRRRFGSDRVSLADIMPASGNYML